MDKEIYIQQLENGYVIQSNQITNRTHKICKDWRELEKELKLFFCIFTEDK